MSCPLVCHFIVRLNQRQKEIKMSGSGAGASLLECVPRGGGSGPPWQGLVHKGSASQGLGSGFYVSPEVCCVCVCALYSPIYMDPGIKRGKKNEREREREACRNRERIRDRKRQREKTESMCYVREFSVILHRPWAYMYAVVYLCARACTME